MLGVKIRGIAVVYPEQKKSTSAHLEVLIEVGKGVVGVVVGRDHELMGVAKYSNIYNNKLLLLTLTLIWRI